MTNRQIYGLENLIEQAVRLYREQSKLSASYLQRKLKVTPRVAQYIIMKLEGRIE